MNNKLTKQTTQVSLVEMRRNSKRFPRLNTVPRDKAIESIKAMVSQAFLYRGQAADDRNIIYIATNLLNELLADYDGIGTKYISLAEISMVIRKTVLSDELYGISVASLYKAVAKYCREEGHDAEEEIRGQFRPITVGLPILMAAAGELLKKSDDV